MRHEKHIVAVLVLLAGFFLLHRWWLACPSAIDPQRFGANGMSHGPDDELVEQVGWSLKVPNEVVSLGNTANDFDPITGTATLELVLRGAHEATYPRAGSASQYEEYHGRPYKR